MIADYACAWVAIGRDWCPAEALDRVRVRLDGRVVELWCCPEHAALLRYAARLEVVETGSKIRRRSSTPTEVRRDRP